jgi:hypothetical protein
MQIDPEFAANLGDLLVAAAAERRVVAVDEYRADPPLGGQHADNPAGIVLKNGEFASGRTALCLQVAQRLPHKAQAGKALKRVRLNLARIEDEAGYHLDGLFQRRIEPAIVRKPKVAPENEQGKRVRAHAQLRGDPALAGAASIIR